MAVISLRVLVNYVTPIFESQATFAPTFLLLSSALKEVEACSKSGANCNRDSHYTHNPSCRVQPLLPRDDAVYTSFIQYLIRIFETEMKLLFMTSFSNSYC